MAKTIFVEIIGNASQFKKELSGAVASTEKANSGFARMGKVAGVAGVALGTVLVAGLEKSIVAAAKFQSEMELVHTQAGATTEEVHNMSAALIDLAKSVGTGPQELAKGLFHIESAGLRGAKALNTLKIAAEGAKVGHADLEATTNALVGALNAGTKGTGDAAHAMGVLNAVIGAGNMRMDDLTEALGTGVLKSAKAFGVSIQDVGAALAEMTRAGVPAVNAATGIKMALAGIAGPSGKAIEAMKSIGLASDELATTMRARGLIAAMAELTQHMTAAGLNATQQGALIIDIFGRRAATPILALTQNIKGIGTTMDGIKANTSAFGANWEATQKTAQFQTEQFRATIQALEIQIGTGLLPIATKLLEQVNELAASFNANLGPAVRVVSAAFEKLHGATVLMYTLFLPIREMLLIWKVEFIALNAAVQGVTAAVNACRGAASAIAAFFTGVFHGAINTVHSAMSGLDAAVDGVRSSLNAVLGAARSVAGFVSGALSGALHGFSAVAHGVASVINAITSALNAAASAARNLASALGSIHVPHISLPSVGGILSHIPHAAGGSVTAGVSYLVGERGPELFTSGASGFITPNNMLGGGGATINVYMPNYLGDVRTAARAIRDELKQLDNRNGAIF